MSPVSGTAYLLQKNTEKINGPDYVRQRICLTFRINQYYNTLASKSLTWNINLLPSATYVKALAKKIKILFETAPVFAT